MEMAIDSGGNGQWRGAPAVDISIGARQSPVMFVFCNDQHFFPAKGVLGGTSARPSNLFKYNSETEDTVYLPQMGEETIQPKERFIALNSTGGGYGDPLDRDPELVRWDVREELVSLNNAREIYGVIINTKPELYAVDYGETEKLRRALIKKRENG